jgi:hypothetical protein
MRERKNPKWWTDDNDTAWERVKAAFRRDWDQTKHDFGANQPDLNQDVGDTVKQAAGKQPVPMRGQPVYDEVEDAHRFGFGARSYYGKRYPAWNSDLELQLQRDWQETYSDKNWAGNRDEIRRGWDYDERERMRKAA